MFKRQERKEKIELLAANIFAMAVAKDAYSGIPDGMATSYVTKVFDLAEAFVKEAERRAK